MLKRCCKTFKDKGESRQRQTHVHELEESVKLAGENENRHTHHVRGVTSEVSGAGAGRHVHKICMNTTDSLGHFHKVNTVTGINIPIRGTNQHVHVLSGVTDLAEGHQHDFLFTTQTGMSIP